MPALIIAIPLFDGNMAVKAYKMCDHNTDIALDIKGDFRSKSQTYYLPGLELIQEIGLEPFSGEMPLFVDTNRFHILTNMITNKEIPPERLILTISASEPVDNKLLYGIEELLGLGYGLAIDGFPEEGLDSYLMGCAGYVILDYKNKNFTKQYLEMKRELDRKQLIISNIPDSDSYDNFSKVKNTLFSGGFYSAPITSGSGDISPLKVNALQLMRQINDEDFELKNIAKTIERDPALSISLLRYINSSAVGLKSKVDSINSAVAILGQKTILRWATIALSVEISQDKPSEITKLSLVRAKFAENLAPVFELGIFQNSLFMTGLFSLLDLILKKPMDQAVNEVAIDNLVREALVDHSGSLYRVLEFIYAYERADWNKISIILINNNISGERVGKAYTDALFWFHQLLSSIKEHNEENDSDAQQ